MSMNQQVKSTWIKGMLSNQYTQGRGYLCQKTADGQLKHCTLGVLIDLAIKAGVKVRVEEDVKEWGTKVRTYDGQPYGLPQAVQEWAGLEESPMVAVGKYKTIHDLVDLNDNGKTFKQIAVLIERDPNI